LGVFCGEYHWHKHDDDDEFFYVIEGQLLIDLEDRLVSLDPRQGLSFPKVSCTARELPSARWYLW
jgi:uncharacterized cupin superfamily protein